MEDPIDSSELISVEFSSEMTMTTTPSPILVEEEETERKISAAQQQPPNDDDDDERNNDESTNVTSAADTDAPATPTATSTTAAAQAKVVTPPQAKNPTTTTSAAATSAAPTQSHNNNNNNNEATPPNNFSECLYGVPEDDELWETFFAQPSHSDEEDDNDDNDNDTGAAENSNNNLDELLWKRQARVRGHVVPLKQLRRLAAQGIPDEGSHRGVVWRLLLSGLPAAIDEWPQVLLQQRASYQQLCQDYFVWDDWNYGAYLRVQRKQEHVKRLMMRQEQVMGHDSSSSHNLVLKLDTDDEYQSVRITATAEPVMDASGAGDAAAEESSTSHSAEDDVLLTPPPQLQRRSSRPTRPTTNTEWLDNPHVLELIPKRIQTAWTTDRGKDLPILLSLMRSFNALRLPDLDDKDGKDVVDQKVADFCDSAVLLDEIHKDVIRTHADLAFFLDPHDDLGRRRYAAIERVLFLWARQGQKRSTGANVASYVQGMNEIVGTLYYVLANDWRTEWAHAAEADTYHLLGALLEEMHHVFVPELDYAVGETRGLQGRIRALSQLLERHDPALSGHLREIGLDASFYAVRWLTTLLSREFLLPDTIRLWDSMLASTHKDNFLTYVCVTMLFEIRHRLLRGDFAQCIQLLQHYPSLSSGMDTLLEASRSLYMYETQITVACHRANLTQHQALLTIKPPPNLIMAFGFSKGVAPPPTLTSSERVQVATQAVANTARNVFRMFSRRSSSTGASSTASSSPQQQQPPANTAASNNPPPLTPQRTSSSAEEQLPQDDPDSPDIYMKAILQSSA